ncbi:MAG: IS1634 family transposase [Propionibacteriaceae bacterium]|jgi:hypothetical protein|nr:IS1634 family transposase [Propionibacteriaceae bacterium]
MFVRISKTRDGVKYAHIVEAYRDESGKSRQRIVERCGKVADLLAADPDALAKLKARASELTAAARSRRGAITYDTSSPSSGGLPLNLGWLLGVAVLDRLGAAEVLRKTAKARGWRVDAARMLETLVAARLACPCSKETSVGRTGRMLLDGGDFGLRHLYQALDQIGQMSLELQQAAFKGVGRTAESLSTVDYGATDYFFHIDCADADVISSTASRGRTCHKRGAPKEHRLNLVIQLVLFCDADGIPVCYQLFGGSAPDMSAFPATVAEFKSTFAPGRVVVIGDKTQNTWSRLGALSQRADGWIVSEPTRKADAKLRAWLDDPTGWMWNTDRTSRCKSTPLKRAVSIKLNGMPSVAKETAEKIVATWSAARAGHDRRTRQDIIAQAKALARDNARRRAGGKNGLKHTALEAVGLAAGETTTANDGLLRVAAKIGADARLDGCQLIRTTEIIAPDEQVIARYRQLFQIEDAFRVIKADLEARPVHVRSPLHVEAHFTVCFLALLVTRLIQKWTGLPAGRLLAALRHLEAIPVGGGVYRICRPTAWDQIDAATGCPLNQDWATLAELRQWRRSLAKAVKGTAFAALQTI